MRCIAEKVGKCEKFASRKPTSQFLARASAGWLRSGFLVCLMLLFVQTAPAQNTDDKSVGSAPLPPPPAAEAATSNVDKADAKPKLDAVPGSEKPAASAEVDAKYRGKLGIFVIDGNNRVTINKVLTGGSAEHSGFKRGDEVLAVNGHRVVSTAQLKSNLRSAADEGSVATFLVSRGGNIQTIEADVSGRFVPESSGNRVQTYYRGPNDEAPSNSDAPSKPNNSSTSTTDTYWNCWPYYNGCYYGGYSYYPTYPYYYSYGGWYRPFGFGYYYPYYW